MNTKGIKKYIILFISALILVAPFFVNGFLIKNDFLLQHVPFYQEFYHMLDARSLGWSWNYFIGINFWASKAYYMVGDIFAWIGYIFYKLNISITNVLFLLTFIKLLIAGIGFEAFMQRIKINANIRILFAIAYMGSSWITIFNEQPVFITFYAFVPYLLMGMEDYLQRNKIGVFTVFSAFILMAQYYLAWPLCIFLLVYWIVRYIQLNEKFVISNFLIKSFKIFGLFIVSLMISAIIWLPSLLHLLSSPRLSTDAQLIDYGLLWSFDDALQILQNFIIPVIKSDISLYRGYWYYFYQIGIYCGCFSVLLAFLYLFSHDDKKSKITNLILLGFGLIILLSPQIGILFHFTYSLRYTFITEIIILIIAAKALDSMVNGIKINKVIIIIISLIIFGGIGLLCFAIPNYRGLDIRNYPEFKMYLLAIVMMILYCLILISLNGKTLNLLIIFGIAEILLQGNTAMFYQINADDIDQEYLDNENIYREIVSDIRQIDQSFYRVYFDHDLSNLGLYFNIPTASTYDSTYEYCLHDFLYMIREYPDVEWNFKMDYPQLYELVDIKYVITNECLDTSKWQYYGNEIKRYEDGYILYAFDSINPALGRSYNQFIDKKEMMAKSEDDQYYLHEIMEQMNVQAIVDDPKEYAKYHNADIIYLDPSYISNDTVVFEFESDDDQFIFFSIPNDKGWKVYDNDQKLEKVDVNGGFIGIEVPAGKHIIRMEYSIYGIKIAGMLSFTGVLAFLIILWRNKQKNLLK